MLRTVETERVVKERRTVVACDNCGTESPLGSDPGKAWYTLTSGLHYDVMHGCCDVCVVGIFGGVIPEDTGREGDDAE